MARDGAGDPRPLTRIDGLPGARHARIDAAPGAHDAYLHLDGHPDLIVATHAFAGRVTLVTVAAGTPPSIRQFAPVPEHLAGTAADPDTVAATRFADLVQRRFRDERVVATGLEQDDQRRWETLTGGEAASPSPASWPHTSWFARVCWPGTASGSGAW